MQFRHSNRAALPAGLLAGLVLAFLTLTAAPAHAAKAQSSSILSLTAGYASIHVKALIEPGDEDTEWWAETSRDNENWSGFPGVMGEYPAHAGPQTVEFDLENEKGDPTKFLLGDTRYYVRVVLFNGVKETFSAPPNPTLITVAVDPPKVLSVNSASEIGYTVAKLSGSVERPSNVDPAFNAHCSFDYVSHSQFIVSGFKKALNKPCATTPLTAPGVNPVSANLTSLKPGTVYHFRLNAVSAGGLSTMVAASTFTTTAITPPVVNVSNPVLGIGTAAHFSGTINPEKGPADAALYDVTWRFECTPKCLDAEGKVLTGPGIPADNSLHAVAADVVLEPNTEYRVRLVASNAGETATAGPVFVSTPALPAIAQTLGVSVTDDSATLGAKINPLNSPVSYQFEWGLTETYDHEAPLAPEQLSRADNAYHFVGAPLTGLAPATTYHYRVVATNTLLNQQTVGADRTFTTRAVSAAPPACPNESSRVGLSANLPDCRAYELVTPGLNGAAPAAGLSGLTVDGVRADGGAIAFVSSDAPVDAEGSTAVTNTVLALRGDSGWTTKSLSAPTPLGSGAYFGEDPSTVGLSSDLAQSVLWSNQPLAGGSSPGGTNLYLRRADGSIVALTKTGAPKFSAGGELSGASLDFTRLFVVSTVKQLPADPVNGGNTYEWAGGNLKLVTLLPGEAPAPSGGYLPEGTLPVVSDDGKLALFKAVGLPDLYLRVNGQETKNVSASQRTVPDATTPAESVGVAADGSEVLFTSHSELTNDANTGRTAGVPNHQGSDLYSYDVGTGKLTDLTADANPADVAAGADVERVVGASRNADHIYFIAAGDLAPGAASGGRNLYVEHGGVIDFVGSDPTGDPGQGYPFYVTPDGRHAAFMSVEGQTGYDNAGKTEVYKYSYGSGLECASCRPSGEPPTGDASIAGRALSDDGARLFFQSTDAVLPQAQSALSNVFEYVGGETLLLTPGAGAAAVLAGASASGDDVFIATFEVLTDKGQGPVFAIYDARVNADVPPLQASTECQGEGCRGAPTSPPQLASPGSAKFEAPGTITAPKSKVIRGSKTTLRLALPERGDLSVVGRGLKPVKEAASGTVTVTLALSPTADKRRLRKGFFKTNAEVLFTSPSGSLSRAETTLKFITSSKGRGGK
jgi:hypothetical protein